MLLKHLSRWSTQRSLCNVFRTQVDLDTTIFPSLRSLFTTGIRTSSSASSTRWKARQSSDPFAREARVQGLKSRAAFKLLEINDKYKIFKKNNTVVDLGYAPGSWSQVAVNRTAPRGRVIGVDLLPAQPPKGASSIQGDFLSPEIQAEVRAYVLDTERGRPLRKAVFHSLEEGTEATGADEMNNVDEVIEVQGDHGYLEMERKEDLNILQEANLGLDEATGTKNPDIIAKSSTEQDKGRVVDVVLSDMSAPWEQTTGFGKRTISDPYHRMMNTSGMPFRDHAGSMDLCAAALSFCFDTLRSGGHFVCKFYQGSEDKMLEKRLKRLFERVHRDKPSASRNESRESYFVALRRKENPSREDVFAD